MSKAYFSYKTLNNPRERKKHVEVEENKIQVQEEKKSQKKQQQ